MVFRKGRSFSSRSRATASPPTSSSRSSRGGWSRSSRENIRKDGVSTRRKSPPENQEIGVDACSSDRWLVSAGVHSDVLCRAFRPQQADAPEEHPRHAYCVFQEDVRGSRSCAS